MCIRDREKRNVKGSERLNVLLVKLLEHICEETEEVDPYFIPKVIVTTTPGEEDVFHDKKRFQQVRMSSREAVDDLIRTVESLPDHLLARVKAAIDSERIRR